MPLPKWSALAAVGAVVGAAGCAPKEPQLYGAGPVVDTCMINGCRTGAFFAQRSAVLRPEDENNLRLFAKVYYPKDSPKFQLFVVIEGHAWAEGNTADEERLSTARAQVVRAFLIDEGLPYDRIVTMSCGRRQPIVNMQVPKPEPQNRLAESRIVWAADIESLKAHERACRIIE